MRDLTKLPESLTREREQQLLAMDRKDTTVRDELLLASLRDCVVYGGTCCQWALDVPELISVCTVALMKSIRNYSVKKAGNPPMRLVSYSKPYVRGEIMRELTQRFSPPEKPGVEWVEDGEEEDIRNRFSGLVGEHLLPEMALIHLREQWEIVKPFLAKLTETERRVLILTEEGQFSLADVGRMTGYTRENIRITRLRALRKIRNLMIDSNIYYESK